jgi:hypothetical protein
MLNLTVDGERRESDSTLKNWAQLLEFLEWSDRPPHRVVTAVRFGGVDEPTFRRSEVLAKRLRDTSSIEVETATADELLSVSAQTAYESLAPLAAAGRRVAGSFHQGELLGAHHDLADFVSGLRMLATLTGKLAAARGVAAERQFFTDGFYNQLCDAVRVLIEREQWEDWDAVSDVLEHDMATLLGRWSGILLALRDGRNLDERIPALQAMGAADAAAGMTWEIAS